MSDQAPSWLSNDAPAAAVATPVVTATVAAPSALAPATAAAAPAAAAPTAPADLAAMEKEQLRGVILFMRLLNLGVSIAVIACCVVLFVGIPNPTYWVLGFYGACGGCLICCLETQIKFFRTIIALNFGFLFNPMFRFMYYILLASVMASFNNLFARIVAGCLVGTAFYNTFVLIRYPAYRMMRDEIAKEEDKRIEAKLREQVRKEAMTAMFSNGSRVD